MDVGVYPLRLDLDRARELRIGWSDGGESTIPLTVLRRACPCATCRAEREERKRNPLAVLPMGASGVDMATVRDAELVGAYALRVTWNDGHATGIYNFELLRELGAAGESEPRPRARPVENG